MTTLETPSVDWFIERAIEFDMGHVVINHSKCSQVHGHRYRVICRLYGSVLDDKGMIMDFGALGQLMRQRIHDVYDHKFIYWAQDNRAHLFEQLPGALAVPCIPTAENLGVLWGGALNLRGKFGIIVHETPNCIAHTRIDNVG